MTLGQFPRPSADAPPGGGAAGLIAHHDLGRGCLEAVGGDALDLLNRLSTNRVDHLRPGHWAPTVLTTDRGRIVDLLAVVHTGAAVRLLTSGGRQRAVLEWLDKYTIMEDLAVADVSAETAVVALAGAGAGAVLGLDRGEPDFLPGRQYPAPTVGVGGIEAVAVGQPLGRLPGYLLVAPAAAAGAVLAGLVSGGAALADAGAWEELRIGAGAPVFGAEMGESYNPLEAGLIGAIDFTKGCYIGQEVIARLDSYRRVQKYLVALSFAAGSEAAAGAALAQDGRPAGTVTSVGRGAGGELRGLGYVRTAAAAAGQGLELRPPAAGVATVVDAPKLFGAGQDFG